MRVYQTKSGALTGTDFHEVWRKASFVYKMIKKKSKRQPYLRSAYFRKDKIFLGLFWDHLFEKTWPDRLRRLRYFSAAVELIENSSIEPSLKEDPQHSEDTLYRFSGLTKEKELFHVQVKFDRSTLKKYLISIFPGKKEKALR